MGGSTTERKTPGLPKAPPNIPVKEKLEKKYFYNVLNNYRSYSYIITVSALDKNKVNLPETYREGNDLGNIILKSSGKGKQGKSPDFKKLSDTAPGWVQEELDFFNQEDSPGKYDFYIDNIDIETYPTPKPITGTALVNKILFDVHEPYSIVGFIDALMAGSRAAGYLHYLDGVFLLKIEFIGYKDNDDPNNPAKPEKINLTTRYIPFRFNKVDVNFDEAGTIYRCEAFGAEDMAFSDTIGSTKTALQLSGVTIKEILQSMADSINKNVMEEAKKSAPDIKDTQVDQIKISFPTFKDGVWSDEENLIAGKKLKELYKDTGIYNFDDVDKSQFKNAYQSATVSTSTQSAIFLPYEPNKWSINFGPKTSVQSIIDGLVRDSEYWRDQIDPSTGVLKTIEDNKVNFWRITAEIKEGDFNPIRKRPRYEITYKITTVKIHKSQVLGFRGVTTNDSGMNIVREYNYLYTGQNVDIKRLRLNFDKLFYERFPLKLGRNDQPSADSQNLSGTANAQQDTNTVESTLTSPNNTVKIVPGTAPSSSQSPSAPEGASSGYNPANQYARESFAQVIASNYSMIKLDMEIVGDPVYLMTGGLGNYYPALLRESDKDYQVFTVDGEANFLVESPFIKIYFRNPTDIDPTSLEQGGTGLLQFKSNYDLSGYYMLTKVNSYFKGGEFTQRLDLNRMPVEISTSDFKPPAVDTTKLFKTVPDEKRQVRKDAGENKVVPPNQRGSLRDLVNGINRFADSLAGAEERINGAIEGALTDVAQAVGGVVAVPARIVGQVTNKIEGTLRGIDDVVTDAADRFRLSPSQLASLSAGELLALVSLAKIIPENVNMSDVEEKGIIVDKKTVEFLPPAQTEAVLSEITKRNAVEDQKLYEELQKTQDEYFKQLRSKGTTNG